MVKWLNSMIRSINKFKKYFSKGDSWFRIFGYGISVVRKQKYHPLFSERYGYRKKIWVGPWGIEWLRKVK